MNYIWKKFKEQVVNIVGDVENILKILFLYISTTLP